MRAWAAALSSLPWSGRFSIAFFPRAAHTAVLGVAIGADQAGVAEAPAIVAVSAVLAVLQEVSAAPVDQVTPILSN